MDFPGGAFQGPAVPLFENRKKPLFSEFDWSRTFKNIFSEHVPNQLLEDDYGDDLNKLFTPRPPFFELDLDAIRAGPALFGSFSLSDDYEELEDLDAIRAGPGLFGSFSLSDDYEGLEDDFVPSYMVRSSKGTKKSSRFRSNIRKCTRRHRVEYPVHRARILRNILKAGYFDSRPIAYGSYGLFGFEF